MKELYTRYLGWIVVGLLCVGPLQVAGQCNNWSITATLTSGSACAASGSFSVSLSGPDVAGLTNVQYGIPISQNGFAVPLNSSPNFNGVPAGQYTVSVVANCGSTIVGRNTTIYMPGGYIYPSLSVGANRASLSCAATGRMGAYMGEGVGPYTFNITAHPVAYTGPLTFTNTYGNYNWDNMPAGNYTIQGVDACMSGTVPKSLTIGSVDPQLAPYTYRALGRVSCDTLYVQSPFIDVNIVGWGGYGYDTTFKASVQISGGLSNPTSYLRMPDTFYKIKLAAGKTIKHCYGETVTYTIHPPCGPDVTMTQAINAPQVIVTTNQNCNTDFTASIGLDGIACLPITYTLHNNGTGANYGPYAAPFGTLNSGALPLGSYQINFSTGDGYTGTGSMTTSPITGNPYSVSLINGIEGLTNYAEGFRLSTSATGVGGVRTIDLFNGPAGYSFHGQWSGNYQYDVRRNQSPTPTTVKFPAGYYVWRIIDDCGTYYVPITVTAQDMYQFTVGTPTQVQSCQGLLITPTGSSTVNGISQPIGYSLLLNGNRMYVNQGGNLVWPVYPQGSSILISYPGTYTIVPTSAGNSTVFVGGYYNPGGFSLTYPNIYTTSYTFTYNAILPIAVDINHTQGFLCKGAGPGQGKIFASGKNGVPFTSIPSPHYQYSLAAGGYGAIGPYIATNNTGIFTGFGGNANAMYDVKVSDTCGAFAVQQLKILDLGTARIISSSKYVACAFGNVQLSAVYLPNATYSWTGPNGFTSSVREPLLTNVGPLNIGVYHVTVTTTECNQTLTDSTTLAMNGNPPKPMVSFECMPRPITLTVTNPSPGLVYNWDFGYLAIYNNGPVYTHYEEPSDTANIKYVWDKGSYNAIALDTTTGCTTYSDTLFFDGNPMLPLHASIYSPHLQICTGDTTILVAQGHSGATTATFQWFKNNVPIAGATAFTYVTNVAGDYKVRIKTGPCDIDTSAAVTVTVIPPPVASISISTQSMCQGDTAIVQANTGTGYSYTWHINGMTVPGAFLPTYKATQTGSYYVTVSNGGCVANSSAVQLTVHAAPVVNLTPNTPRALCPGETVQLTTPGNLLYSYTWERNGVLIPGATAYAYTASTAGDYRVIVATPQCPHVSSVIVPVTMLPNAVNLGNDTTICAPGAFPIALTVDAAFTQVSWSTGATSQQINVSAPGKYWVTATNRCGVFTDTIQIHAASEFMPALPDDTVICNATNSGVLRVPALLQGIHWSTGATTASITVNKAGTYWVEGMSPCGIMRDTVKVTFCAPDIKSIALSKDSICEGDCVRFVATVDNYPTAYYWSFVGGNPDTSNAATPGMVCYSKEGVYPVVLHVKNEGGEDTYTTSIVVSSKPKPRFKDTAMTVSYKSSISLPACAAAQRVDWYIGDSLVCSNCQNITIDAKYFRTIYRCVVSNGDCMDSCSYTLRVVDIPHDLWLPDAFTPNGDGRNDVFRIITDNPNVIVINLAVYNRWGQRVFTSNMNNGGWDGKVGGKDADGGIYFWQIRYKVMGGSDEVYYRKGDVMVVR